MVGIGRPAYGCSPMRITDAHHHIWWLDRTPWLSGPPAPRIFGEHDALRRDGRAFWRAQLARLAERPHVHVKLSGLGTFTRSYEPEGVRPVVEQTIELFGAERCLFGSNVPIEKLWTDYGRLLDVFTQSLAGCSGAERELILDGTATRLYRL